jgi:hypothetical protein
MISMMTFIMITMMTIIAQVWRPVSSRTHSYNYTLVGQTFMRPADLRFCEITLRDRQLIDVRRGDVIGIQFADLNPLAWSSVPCSSPAVDNNQRYLYVRQPATDAAHTGNVRPATGGNSPMHAGKTVTFTPAPHDERFPCRHYSLTAVMGKHTWLDLTVGLCQAFFPGSSSY